MPRGTWRCARPTPRAQAPAAARHRAAGRAPCSGGLSASRSSAPSTRVASGAPVRRCAASRAATRVEPIRRRRAARSGSRLPARAEPCAPPDRRCPSGRRRSRIGRDERRAAGRRCPVRPRGSPAAESRRAARPRRTRTRRPRPARPKPP